MRLTCHCLSLVICLLLYQAAPSIGGKGANVPDQLVLYLARLNRFCEDCRDESYKFICTASIIGNSWLLTAAHCFNESHFPASHYQIVYHEFPGYDKNKTVYLKEIYLHDNFSSHTGLHDIALVQLDDFIELGKRKTTRIALNSFVEIDEKHNDSLQIFGYGRNVGENSYNKFNSGKGMLFPKEDCVQRWEDSAQRFQVKDKQFCIGLDVFSPVGGDSGGAVVVEQNGKTYLAGVISYAVSDGFKYASEKEILPGVYTDVKSHLGWNRTIEKNANQTREEIFLSKFEIVNETIPITPGPEPTLEPDQTIPGTTVKPKVPEEKDDTLFIKPIDIKKKQIYEEDLPRKLLYFFLPTIMIVLVLIGIHLCWKCNFCEKQKKYD